MLNWNSLKQVSSIRPILLLLIQFGSVAVADNNRDWPTYGGDSGNRQYSSLAQINRDNVRQLQAAWTYRSARGEALFPTSELQLNPLIVRNTLFGRNPAHQVFAVNAATGAELWTFDPFADEPGLLGSYMRGLSYWEQGKDRRLFFSASHFLYALDAKTGQPISSFADNGVLDLRRHLDRDPDSISVYSPSPGVVFENLIIMGSAVTEGEGAAPGHIRAYDLRSGQLVWRFNTIPRPGEFGHDSWPAEAWKTAGGANAWAGLSVDPERAMVFVATGSPTPDFDGSKRPGDNLFGNSVVALDARTGQYRWHFQAVRHDIWDRDLSSAPTLVRVARDGKLIDAVAQASKQGVLYLLERDTGSPVFPIDNVRVPASEVPGEQAASHQPRVSLPQPFTQQAFSRADITDINAGATAHVEALYGKARPFAYMRPIGLQPTILFPGFYGGANWGGGAFDPVARHYFINATETPHLVSISPVQAPADGPGFGAFTYRKHCAGCHGLKFQGFYPYAPPLTGVSERLARGDAMKIVTRGKGRMMSFANLSAHERQAVLEYIYRRDRGELESGDTADTTRTVYLFNGYTDFLDDRGYPANKPPWGTLNALDLDSGKRLWQVPLGEYAELTAEGVPLTGTRNFGGPIVTAGRLVFIGASSDEKLRAFDAANGNLLWEYPLPAAAYSTPATYMIDGRQYLVVVCSGGKLGTAPGDHYIAFSLPTSGMGTANPAAR